MIIFISGSDSFQARQAILKIKDKYLAKNPDGVELIEISADSSTINWADLQAVPLFATSRLIIIKEAGLLAVAEQEKLAHILSNLPETTVVVVWDGKALPPTSTLAKELETAKKIDAAPLEGIKLKNWIKNRATELKLDLSEAILQTVLDNCGADLWRIESELAYLSHAEDGVVSGTKKRLAEPFIVFRYLRNQNWPALRQHLADELHSGTPIELTIGSLAAAIRKEVSDDQLRLTLTDLLMDIDVGVKTGLLDNSAAVTLLIAHLPKPANDRVQWETTWRETF